jgi:hypothetical protein
MGDNDDNFQRRRSTPPTKDEWPEVWETLKMARLILSPIYAVITNWRALAIVAVFVVWMNNPKLIAFLQSITGQGQ